MVIPTGLLVKKSLWISTCGWSIIDQQSCHHGESVCGDEGELLVGHQLLVGSSSPRRVTASKSANRHDYTPPFVGGNCGHDLSEVWEHLQTSRSQASEELLKWFGSPTTWKTAKCNNKKKATTIRDV